jgi:peptide chain release factor 2
LESIFDLDGLREQLEKYNKEMSKDGFWDDPAAAQKLMKRKKSLENELNRYDRIEQGLTDTEDLIELAMELNDEDEAKEIQKSFRALQDEMEELKLNMLLSEKYDSNDAIITVYAGTGGVDAMDWAEMLDRMYLRYCEHKGFKTEVVDLQNDTVAGIKSATIMVAGDNAYGYLKGETGVHRLVRISPFNSAGKRQTSFAGVEVVPDLGDELDVVINPNDLKIDTYRSSGAGGQHVNTTDSAIRITHLPTNIVVTCQNERSQLRNKEVALKILTSKLTKLAEQEHKANLNELKGDMSQATWGAQIRNYVFQPYTLVKDTRTGAETGNIGAVMDGDLDLFIRAKLSQDAKERAL